MEMSKEMWEAMDRIFFGSNDPEVVRSGIDRLEQQMAWRNSSLGRYMRSLRRVHRWSLAQMAHKAGVTTQVWKSWEHDFLTPTKEELEEVIRRLKWSRIQEEQLWPLWEQAARFRLRRLTTFHNDAMAAKGVASEANIAWLSVDEETRARLTAWGEEKGYTFPRDLAEFLSTLDEEEQRESWVDEILGGAGWE